MSGTPAVVAAEDMDWISSVDTGCSAAIAAIAKTTPALRLFIREVREARTELDAVLAELHSLEGVVDILKDDASSFPTDLAKRTPPMLEHCTSIVEQIAGYMHVCNGLGLSKRDKKFRWLAIRADMVKLRMTLEGYKSILAVVTDLVGLNKSRKENDALSVHSDSSEYHDAMQNQTAMNDDIRSELTHVMADMGSLRGRLQGDFRSNYAVADLESYLDAMQLDATNLGFRMNASYRGGKSTTTNTTTTTTTPAVPGKSVDRGSRFSTGTTSSVGDEPDSAIDINDGPPSPYRPSPSDDRRSVQDGHPAPPDVSSLPIIEIDEFLDEIKDDDARAKSRAPTPPPKARSRVTSTGDNPSLAPHDMGRPSSVRSVSEYSTMLHDATDGPLVPRRTSSMRSIAASDGDARSTLGSLMGIRPPFSESDYTPQESYKPAATTTTPITFRAIPYESACPPPAIKDSRTRSSRLFGRNSSFSVPGLSTRPGTSSDDHAAGRPVTRGRSSSLVSAPSTSQISALVMSTSQIGTLASPAPLPGHTRQSSAATTTTVATTSSGGKAPRLSIGTARTAASIRSNSSRISSVLTRMTSWKPSRIHKDETPAEDPEPDDIFGVSLKKSMQMASAAVRTHHDGSKGSSRREFPRCILACVSFIKENGGVARADIFGGDFAMASDEARLVRVAALKEGFSTAPCYGDGNIDWARFDVHDAAELIVLFLQQMPKPLVTETVAKRWIVLSRQATLPGSMGFRLDACIDFWDEALLGIRGAARSMLKLLLNLWGDIADAADINDMTAERLAARLLGPLMHLPAGKYTTDFMLGLAFLIRKRSEYATMLRGDGRKSKAAF